MKKAIAAKRAKLSNIPLIIQNNDLSMFQLEKVFKKAKNDSKPRNPDFSPTPIKELLKNQGFAKLSHKFTQNTQIPNELRVSPFPMLDKRKSIDANKSIDLIIEACGIEHASILNLGSRLEKDRYDISNKHKFINDLAKIRTTNFRKSEKEELVKYQLLPKEMTDSKMFQSLSKKKLLVFESRSQSRRNTKSSNN